MAVNEVARWKTINEIRGTKFDLTTAQIGGYIDEAVQNNGPFAEKHGGVPPKQGKKIWEVYQKHLRGAS